MKHSNFFVLFIQLVLIESKYFDTEDFYQTSSTSRWYRPKFSATSAPLYATRKWQSEYRVPVLIEYWNTCYKGKVPAVDPVTYSE